MTDPRNTPAVQNNNVPAVFNFFDPTQFETMQRVCKMFAKSELVPEMYRESDKNSIEKAMANSMIAIEMAQRIGASPLMIMQNLVIIYGRPSWSSKFLIATVNTCGRFNPLQYKFANLGKVGKIPVTTFEKKWVDGANGARGSYKSEVKTTEFDGTNLDNVQCIAYTSAKNSENVLESPPVSIEMAIKEGWYTKSGSKWQTMPQLMLTYRSASLWTSTYAPELSMGMKTDDELRDIIDISYEDVTVKPKENISEEANKTEITFEEVLAQTSPEPTTPETPTPTQEVTNVNPPEGKKEPVQKDMFHGTADRGF